MIYFNNINKPHYNCKLVCFTKIGYDLVAYIYKAQEQDKSEHLFRTSYIKGITKIGNAVIIETRNSVYFAQDSGIDWSQLESQVDFCSRSEKCHNDIIEF